MKATIKLKRISEKALPYGEGNAINVTVSAEEIRQAALFTNRKGSALRDRVNEVNGRYSITFARWMVMDLLWPAASKSTLKNPSLF